MKFNAILALLAFFAFTATASAIDLLPAEVTAPCKLSQACAAEEMTKPVFDPYVYSADLATGYSWGTVDGKAVNVPTATITGTVGYDDPALPVIPTASVSLGIIPGVTTPTVLATVTAGVEAPFTDTVNLKAGLLASALASTTSVNYLYGASGGADIALSDKKSLAVNYTWQGNNNQDNLNTVKVGIRFHF